MLMFHTTSAFSRACRDRNEDAYVIGDDFMVLADGASGVGKNYMRGWKTDAQWFSSSLVKVLSSLIARDRGRTSIQSLVAQALHLLNQEWYQAVGMDMHGKLPSWFKPSASLVVVRLLDSTQEVEAYALGDATILVGLRNGKAVKVMDDTNCLRDASMLAEAVEAAETAGITLREVMPQFASNKVTARQGMNTVDGYWVADLSAVGVPHGLHETFPLADVQDAALMSDGYATAQGKVEGIKSSSDFLEALRQDRIIEVGREVIQMLSDDADYALYPRTKLVDDATVTYGSLP